MFLNLVSLGLSVEFPRLTRAARVFPGNLRDSRDESLLAMPFKLSPPRFPWMEPRSPIMSRERGESARRAARCIQREYEYKHMTSAEC